MLERLMEIELRVARAEIQRLRSALIQIRDIAEVGGGVEFCAMLADRALNGDDDGKEEAGPSAETGAPI